jgi:hypothetical protein
MSEFERKELPSFILNIGTEKLVCTPENTMGFLYENEDYDHIFYIISQEDDNMRGYHIFRHLLGNDFDILVRRMIDGGYVVENEEEISEADLCAYTKSLPDYYELKDPEENWGPTKREQARKWGQFVAHLAEQIANGKAELDI